MSGPCIIQRMKAKASSGCSLFLSARISQPPDWIDGSTPLRARTCVTPRSSKISSAPPSRSTISGYHGSISVMKARPFCQASL